MFIRETFKYISISDTASRFFIAELVLMIIPLIMFLRKKTLRSSSSLFAASTFVIAGVLLNRINCFIEAYTPFYDPTVYNPSFGEISVTIGCMALLVVIYKAIVVFFPVISQEKLKQESR
jgi:Ni/Fe-hydrogenase subunit HybB-like protein